MKSPKLLHALLSMFFILFIYSCKDNYLQNEPEEDSNISLKSVIPYSFDWEVDYMPTPPGQIIPSPWVGAGSLASVYGIDVLNDRKASDGWVLMYNTFDPTSEAQLINPYFILYNKYRGLMRVFIYITTEFYTPSSNVQDAITIVSPSPSSTSLLNFVGKEIIDLNETPTRTYTQIQPKPVDNLSPTGSYKWYMMQYELAYDPNLSTIPYDQIQLVWSLNSVNVTEVSLGGESTGTIKGTIGSAASSGSNFMSQLIDGTKNIGKGVLAGVGSSFITNNTLDSTTGANDVGIGKSTFKNITKGITSALTNTTTGSMTSVLGSILNGVFGGSSSGPTVASFTLNTDISLDGTFTSSGSFPSTPISFWVPGTNIASNAIGPTPLYNAPLGVFNFLPGAPKIETHYSQSQIFTSQDPWNGQTLEYRYRYLCFPQSVDYSDYLIYNMHIHIYDGVTVEVLAQDFFVKYYRKDNPNLIYTSEYNPASIRWEDWIYGPEHGSNPPQEPVITEMFVRFTLQVNNQDDNIPKPIIYKTLKL